MLIGGFWTLLYFGVTALSEDAKSDYGAFEFHPCFRAAYLCLFLTLIIIYPIMYIFK